MALTKSVIQPPFDIDAQRFIYATGLTRFEDKGAVNYLVKGFKANGLWTKMIALYPFVGGNAWSCKFNLKNPRDSDLAFRLSFVANPTITYSGVDWNGTTQYANTFLTPTAFLSLNDNHLSYYSRENVGEAGIVIGCNDTNNYLHMYPRYTTDLFYIINNAASVSLSSIANTDARGLFVNNRISSTSVVNIKNGVSTTNSGFNSVGLPTPAIYIGARNNNGSPLTFATKQCAFASIGTGLSSADAFNMYNIVQQFQTILNRAVN